MVEVIVGTLVLVQVVVVVMVVMIVVVAVLGVRGQLSFTLPLQPPAAPSRLSV